MTPPFNPALALSIFAIATELTTASILWALGAGRRYQQLRWFVLFTGAACLFSVSNLAFPSPGASEEVIVAAGRGGGLIGSIAAVMWLAYVRVRAGRTPFSGWSAGVSTLAIGFGLACLVPDLVYRDTIVSSPVPWLGVTYRLPEPTGLAVAAYTSFLAPLVVGVYFAMRGGNLCGRWMHLGAAIMLVGTAINDALMSYALLASPYVLELTFVAMATAVAFEISQGLARDAGRLEQLSSELSLVVDERTQQLIAAQSSLTEAEQLAAVGRLAAGVGHEINNPLTYVKTNLECALGETAAPDEQREALSEALCGVERIANIVSDLRVLAQPASTREQSADLRAVVDEAARIAQASSTCAPLFIDLPERIPVIGASTRLVQVFTNLLTNAFQAVQPRGDAARVDIAVLHAGRNEIQVAVRDNGMGMSPGDLKRAFQPFFTTRRERGTGLGLPISRALVEGAGGRLVARSAQGEGSVFTVTLLRSAHAESRQRRRTPPRSPAAVRPAARILVIDDDRLVARAIARILRGEDLTIAGDGAAAREMIETHDAQFDAIVCDVVLPDCTGVDLYEDVAHLWPRLAERFVFITGGAVDERARNLLEGGTVPWLGKPLDATRLRSSVSEILSLASDPSWHPSVPAS